MIDYSKDKRFHSKNVLAMPDPDHGDGGGDDDEDDTTVDPPQAN